MNVKVVDYRSPSFKQDLIESITTTGFAVLVNHMILKQDIDKAQTVWREFFLSNKEYKNSLINAKDPNLGYSSFGSEKAVGFDKPDLKEFFHWQPGKIIPTSTLEVTRRLFTELNYIGLRLLDTIEESGAYYHACAKSNNTILRTLYYPAMDFSAEPGSVRAAAHEDINFITLLVAASAPGLEVKDVEGNWHAVPHEENSIIVNVGDMLQLISGGKFKSTTHRVVNPDDSTSDRISMPLFMHPHSDTLLAPDFTAQQFLNQRLAEIYGANKK